MDKDGVVPGVGVGGTEGVCGCDCVGELSDIDGVEGRVAVGTRVEEGVAANEDVVVIGSDAVSALVGEDEILRVLIRDIDTVSAMDRVLWIVVVVVTGMLRV